MVGASWFKNLLNKKKDISYELDRNKDGLKRLIKLTERLGDMDNEIQYYNKFLEAVTNSLEFPMWVKDTKGCFLFVNKVYARLILRTTVEKALSLTDSDFKGDALALICMESDKQVRKTLKTLRFIEHARYIDGKDVWLDVVKTPLIVDGKLTGVIGTAKDISTFVSKEIRDHCVEPGSVEIDLNLEYYVDAVGDRRKNDLKGLLEEYTYEC